MRTIAKTQGVAWGLAMNATDIYWGVGEGAVFVCPRAGCADPNQAPALARGVGAYGIAIDTTNVYIAERSDNRVSWCPLGSGCPHPFDQTANAVAVPDPTSLAVRDGTLYWTSARNGFVASCTIASCAATMKTIATNLASPARLVVDDDGLWWGEAGIANGGVMKPNTGRLVHRKWDGSIVVLADGRNVDAVATDTSTVYWKESDGWFVRCAKSGCNGAPTRVAFWLTAYPSGLAVDDRYIYWAEHYSPGAIARAKKD